MVLYKLCRYRGRMTCDGGDVRIRRCRPWGGFPGRRVPSFIRAGSF